MIIIEIVWSAWKKFKQTFQIYLVATDLQREDEAKKVAVFLNFIGEEGLELLNSFDLTRDNAKKLDIIMKRFDDYCTPKKNVIFERYKFNSIVQRQGQTMIRLAK